MTNPKNAKKKADDGERALHMRLHSLAREHADAAARVEEYARRRFLTPGEQLEMKALQRLKLLKKDQLTALKTQLG